MTYIILSQVGHFMAIFAVAVCIVAYMHRKPKHETNMNLSFVLDRIETEYENYLKMLRDGHMTVADAQETLRKGMPGYVFHAALGKALAVFVCDDDRCQVDQYSSRVCEQGTKGCTVAHAGASSYSPTGLVRKEVITIRRVWASGGSTGWCDYLMSDNSIRTLRVADIVPGETFPPNDGSYKTITPGGCEICGGSKSGTPGNENIIDGKRVCDYCHADGSYLGPKQSPLPKINVIFQPPRAEKAEPHAHLIYEGEVFQIGYTLMHWMSGWVSMGANGFTSDYRIVSNLKAVLNHINACMMWDANPPPEGEHMEMMQRWGHKVERHVYECPHPELTVYGPGYPKQ